MIAWLWLPAMVLLLTTTITMASSLTSSPLPSSSLASGRVVTWNGFDGIWTIDNVDGWYNSQLPSINDTVIIACHGTFKLPIRDELPPIYALHIESGCVLEILTGAGFNRELASVTISSNATLLLHINSRIMTYSQQRVDDQPLYSWNISGEIVLDQVALTLTGNVYLGSGGVVRGLSSFNVLQFGDYLNHVTFDWHVGGRLTIKHIMFISGIVKVFGSAGSGLINEVICESLSVQWYTTANTSLLITQDDASCGPLADSSCTFIVSDMSTVNIYASTQRLSGVPSIRRHRAGFRDINVRHLGQLIIWNTHVNANNAFPELELRGNMVFNNSGNITMFGGSEAAHGVVGITSSSTDIPPTLPRFINNGIVSCQSISADIVAICSLGTSIFGSEVDKPSLHLINNNGGRIVAGTSTTFVVGGERVEMNGIVDIEDGGEMIVYHHWDMNQVNTDTNGHILAKDGSLILKSASQVYAPLWSMVNQPPTVFWVCASPWILNIHLLLTGRTN
jgi:hypothetical protein